MTQNTNSILNTYFNIFFLFTKTKSEKSKNKGK